MITSLLMLMSLLAQTGDSQFTIVLKDGTRLTGFVDERDLTKTLVQVRLDEPWSVEPKTLTINGDQIANHYPPTAVELEAYYEKGWTEHGGVQVDTPHGKVWVAQTEKELAERAAEMAKANEDAVLKTIRVETPVGGDVLAETVDGGPGFGQLWGAHIAVLTLGVGLAGLVVWFLILE